MTQYKLDNEAFERLKKRGAHTNKIASSVLVLFALGMILWVWVINEGEIGFVTIYVTLSTVLFVVLGFVLSRKFNRKMYRSIQEGVTLTITENMIIWEQYLMKPVSIYHNEIREISRDVNGKIHIACHNAVKPLVIPAIMHDMEKLEKQLSHICPITPHKTARKHDLLNYALIAGAVAGGVIVLTSNFSDDADFTTIGRLVFFLSASLVFARIVFNKSIVVRVRRISAFFLFMFGVNSILALLKLLGYINF